MLNYGGKNYQVTKITLNSAGIKELLKSSEVMSYIEGKAQKVAQSCGSGYEVATFTGFDRAHAIVKAATREAKADNKANNTLLRNLR